MALKKWVLKNKVEVGTDEAGRGCLAGSVVAAALEMIVNRIIKDINEVLAIKSSVLNNIDNNKAN
ncbi:MAG: hypothetical protein WC389_15020 [Lutibacter sp.]